MSASLVGSEMCIRDSAGTAPSSAIGPLTVSAPAPAPRFRNSRSLQRLRCLLYTSDAADDM
eukprot:2184828-Alexandrium_andersonii.AAC.1